MSVYFCGIDLSVTNTGLAVVEYLGDSKFNLIDIKSITPNPRTKGFNKKLESLECFIFATESFSSIKDSKFFVLENYSFGSPGRLTDLAELAGLYKGHIIRGLGKSYDVIAPQTVKKIITGSGRADKNEVQESLKNFVVNIENFTFNNYDESDAVAVAVSYGLQMEEIQNGNKENKKDISEVKQSNRRRKSN
jgi:crossover junction endodeoxyribonuclease RuvC|nr:MAG TPA: RuvC [Bacteriophage sp.]